MFLDFQTGSTWTLWGTAIDGPLADSDQRLLPHRNEFWFAFAAFSPEARVMDG